MAQLTEFEKQREENIAKNRAILAELDLKGAAAGLGFPASKPKPEKGAKPVQPSHPRKRKAAASEVPTPRRQSSRLNKPVINANETPGQKRKREMEEELKRIREQEERLEREEQERVAKRPRHQNLNLSNLGDEISAQELMSLTASLQGCARTAPSQENEEGRLDPADPEKGKSQVTELKAQFENLKIVSRAKVTDDRVYSSFYHPEKTKDLIFFGDKHGQLGIWDALAPPEEVKDEDGDVTLSEEGGKIFHLQPHWPPTSKSSISCIKVDPLNTRNVFTSAYDCTLRSTSFESGISREVFALDDVLISSFDVPPRGQELWISDTEGGLTHSDVREQRSRSCRYQLANTKIGCVSVNPAHPEGLLVSSNNRSLTLWDARMLSKLPVASLPTPPPSSPIGPRGSTVSASGPMEIDSEAMTNFLESKQGKGTLIADWGHNKSVSSAYWDPSGRQIVSTSYDDTIRLWNVEWSALIADKTVKSFKPFSRLHHNCQTGKWLTILKSQWNQNPDVYPHFTVGNMNHSLNVIAATGEIIAALSDRTKITAVQAVTCSHPRVVARIASGNASGRCTLWATADSEA